MCLELCILDSYIAQVQPNQALIPSNTYETKVYWAYFILRILTRVKWHQNERHNQHNETTSEDATSKYLLDDSIITSAHLKINLVSEGKRIILLKSIWKSNFLALFDTESWVCWKRKSYYGFAPNKTTITGKIPFHKRYDKINRCNRLWLRKRN